MKCLFYPIYYWMILKCWRRFIMIKIGKSSKSTFFYVGAFIILAILLFYSYKVVEPFVSGDYYNYYYKTSNGRVLLKSRTLNCPTSGAYKNYALTLTGCNIETVK